MVERLPNYDKFQELYNFYTTEGGLNPMQASGMLGNIYAESRGNPQAINPQDGSDGSDSRGIIQWNGPRDNALRNFASQRGEVADGLLTQARFSIFEGTQGSERNNFQGAIQGDSAGQIALQLAQKYIRPAAQHIPQREAYGDMMYDIFANGNPNGVAAGLQFSPQQGEALSRQPDSGLSYGNDMPAMDERTGQPVGRGFDPSSISAKLMELANPRTVNGFDDPTPPMAGPRVAMAEALDPQTGSPNVGQADNPLATSREAPSMRADGATYGGDGNEPNPQEQRRYGGDGNEPNPEDSINAEIDAQLPTGEGQTNASTIINEDYIPVIAEEAALSMGVPVDEAPRSVAEVARAASAPAPDPEDTSEEAEKKRTKRLLAADMLETLSVGLGQMGAGQAVSLGGVIQGQAERRAGRAELEREAVAKEQAAQQQRQQMQTVAQQFTDMGMGGMAQLAMSGPDGLEEAMSTLGTINGRAPTANSVMERMTPEQRREAMIAAGVPADAASAVEKFPDLSQEMLKTYAIPDPDAAGNAARQSEGQALLSASIPFMADPVVSAAARRLDANPQSTEAMTALQNAIKDAGGELPEPPMGAGLVNAFAEAAGLGPDNQLVQQALNGDVAAQEMLQEAAAAGSSERAERAAQQNVASESAAADAAALVEANSLTPDEGNLVARLGTEEGMRQVREQREAARAADAQGEVNRTARAVGETFIANAATTAGQRAGLTSLFANVKTDAGLANAIRVAEDQYGLTEQVKTALASNSNPAVRQALVELNRATSGTPTATQAAAEARFAGLEERSNTLATNLDVARPLVAAMEDVVTRVTAPDYDRYSGGPFDSTLAFGQNILNQVLGPEAAGLLQAPDQNFGARQMEGQIGQYFAQFRATGSGASSDMESKNFMRAMPNVGDNALKQAGLAQRIIRAQEMVQLELAARREFAMEHINDPSMLGDEAALDAYIDEAIEGSGMNTFPELNQGSENYLSDLADDIRTGNITPTTVIRVSGPDGEPYYGFADEVLTKKFGAERANTLLGGTR